MADIKTRDAVKGTIKTIDKAAIATERMKSAYAKTKDKAEQGCYTDESSATEYAADRLSYGADRIKDEGIHQFNKQGQKAVKETRENIGKAKDKISSYKQKKAAKAALFLYFWCLMRCCMAVCGGEYTAAEILPIQVILVGQHN